MIEVPISIVAWVSVVMIQAIIHYVVFGARRDRIQHEDETVFETLSLSTSDSCTELDIEPSSTAKALGSQVAVAVSFSSLLDLAEHEMSKGKMFGESSTSNKSLASLAPSRSSFSSTLDETVILESSQCYLMQTGKDILRVRRMNLL
jgi:hypothetical protein